MAVDPAGASLGRAQLSTPAPAAASFSAASVAATGEQLLRQPVRVVLGEHGDVTEGEAQLAAGATFELAKLYEGLPA